MGRIIIDVRESVEFAQGHIQGAINIPPMDLMRGSEKLADIPKDTEIILYCVSGARSRTSAMILASQGFTNVINGINKDHVLKNYLT